MASARLQIDGLSKDYPGVKALDRVALRAVGGEVCALVGENGAGKSTLIEILAGVIGADGGRVSLNGAEIEVSDPQEARRLGIGVVHQHSHLLPDLSVAENLALRCGYAHGRLGQIAWGEVEQRAARAVETFVADLDVGRMAGSLSGVEKQLVELAFAFDGEPRLLILDEPTAVLPRRETEQLFARVRDFVDRGNGALFITHRLDEVFELADRVAVLRDGQLAWEGKREETDRDELIRAMVGRQVDLQRHVESEPGEGIALRVEGLTTRGDGCASIDLELHRGEVYGIYGLVGAGQSALCEGLFGLRESSGRVCLGERDIGNLAPAERVRAGLGYVPAERRIQGMFYAMSVGENLSLAALEREWIDKELELERNLEEMRQLEVRAQGLEQGVGELSGGNQQKVLLGRWLQTAPRVLILEEPTQGVDVGAKGEIHRIIRNLAAEGVAVLVVSAELPEILALAHRVGVMRDGRLVGELDGGEAESEEILQLALPVSQEEERQYRGASSGRKGGGAQGRRELSLVMLIALLSGICTWLAPAFATWQNLGDILVNNGVLLIGALGISLVIIAGGIDISIGAVLGLAAVIAGLGDKAGWPVPALAGGALVTGAVLGLVNGGLSVHGRVHAIVITLGTLTLFRGAIVQLTGGKWILNLSEELTGVGSGKLLGIPILIWMGLMAALAVHGFLRYSRPGRRLYALGSDPEGAGFVGIYDRRVMPWAFGLCGLLLGLAGLLQAARYGQVQTNVGMGFELKAIAAAVIGGVHIAGGRGRALGTLLGTLLIGLIANVLVLLHVSPFWEGIFVGCVILLTVGLDALMERGEERI